MDIFVIKSDTTRPGYRLEFDLYRKNRSSPKVLLLCQGFSLSKDYWRTSIIEHVFLHTTINNVLLYNYRGFTSEQTPTNNLIGIPPAEMNLNLIARDLKHFLEHMEDTFWGKDYEIVLLGHSMGSFVVHEFIAHYAELFPIRGIISVSGGCHCSFDFVEKMNNQNWEHFINQGMRSKSLRFATSTTLLLYATMIFFNRLKNKCDFPQLRNLSIPFLDIMGEQDHFLTFRKNGNCLDDNWNPNFYSKVMIPNGNHHLFNQHPREVYAILSEFIRKIF